MQVHVKSVVCATQVAAARYLRLPAERVLGSGKFIKESEAEALIGARVRTHFKGPCRDHIHVYTYIYICKVLMKGRFG